MSDLKQQLDAEARAFEIAPDAFGHVVARAGRRARRRRIEALVVGAAVGLAGVTAGWLAFRPAHRALDVGASSPAPGPLVGEIVLAGATTDGPNQIAQLMVMDPGDTMGRVLSASPYPQWDPAVSPDGNEIAYRGYFGPEEGDYDLYVMQADGAGVVRLTHGALAVGPAWSPDGSQIAFGSSGHDATPGAFVGRAFIDVIDADGSGLHAVTDPPGSSEDSWPTWSPDGSELAFVRTSEDAGSQIFTTSVGGAAATRLSSSPGDKSHPSWSPDGSTIVFQATEHGSSQILAIPAAGGDPTQLTQTSGNSTNPVWIDGGRRIAFVYQSGSTIELRTMSADGSDVVVVASSDQPPLAGTQGSQ